MPNREKIIKGLECLANENGGCYSDYPYYVERSSTCFRAMACDALTLLQEQEPVEPREQEETRTWTVCGNCSQHLISKWLWCPYCGRKVKWDE